MALTYGFYNSVKGDRKYDAMQFSEIIDTLIIDGIIPSKGQLFAVTTANNGMQINVGTGMAWFFHSWTKNDSIMVLTVSESDITRPRIDAVVLEVDRSDPVRANSIKIVKGEPNVNAEKPTLVMTDKVHQYPLAYVTVPAAAEEIKAENIESMIGRTPTVFATGVLETVPLDDLWNQWEGEWDTWFAAIKLQLSGDIVTNLQLQIEERVKIADKATNEDASAGTSDDKWMTPARTKQMIEGNDEMLINGVSSNVTVDSIFVEPNIFSNIILNSVTPYGLLTILETNRYTLLTNCFIYDKNYGILDNVVSNLFVNETSPALVCASYVNDNQLYYIDMTDTELVIVEVTINTNISNKTIGLNERIIYRSTALRSSTFHRLYGTKDYLALYSNINTESLTYIELGTFKTASYTITDLYSYADDDRDYSSFYFARADENKIVLYSSVFIGGDTNSNSRTTSYAILSYNRIEINLSNGQVINSVKYKSINIGSQYCSYGCKTVEGSIKIANVIRERNLVICLGSYSFTKYSNSSHNAFEDTNSIIRLVRFDANGPTVVSGSKTLNSKSYFIKNDPATIDLDSNKIAIRDSNSVWSASPSIVFIDYNNFNISYLTNITMLGAFPVAFTFIKKYGYLVQFRSSYSTNDRFKAHAFIAFDGKIKMLSPLYNNCQNIMNSCARTSSGPYSMTISSSLICVPCDHDYYEGSIKNTDTLPITSLIDFAKPMVRTIRSIPKEQQ